MSGNGKVSADCVPTDIPTPNAATMDSGASGPAKKLAAEALMIGDAIVNVKAFDVPPPGGGLNTVT